MAVMTRLDERGPPVHVDAGARDRLRAALDRPGVVAAYLFCSQARGAAGPLSDVDIAVWADAGLDARERLDGLRAYAAAVERALG
jgi:predicted nucleotidyltransferase